MQGSGARPGEIIVVRSNTYFKTALRVALKHRLHRSSAQRGQPESTHLNRSSNLFGQLQSLASIMGSHVVNDQWNNTVCSCSYKCCFLEGCCFVHPRRSLEEKPVVDRYVRLLYYTLIT